MATKLGTVEFTRDHFTESWVTYRMHNSGHRIMLPRHFFPYSRAGEAADPPIEIEIQILDLEAEQQTLFEKPAKRK